MVRESVPNFLGKFDGILTLPVIRITPYESDPSKILSDEKQSPTRVFPLRLLALTHPASKCCRSVLGGRCTRQGMGLRTTPMFLSAVCNSFCLCNTQPPIAIKTVTRVAATATNNFAHSILNRPLPGHLSQLTFIQPQPRTVDVLVVLSDSRARVFYRTGSFAELGHYSQHLGLA